MFENKTRTTQHNTHTKAFPLLVIDRHTAIRYKSFFSFSRLIWAYGGLLDVWMDRIESIAKRAVSYSMWVEETNTLEDNIAGILRYRREKAQADVRRARQGVHGSPRTLRTWLCARYRFCRKLAAEKEENRRYLCPPSWLLP